MNLISVVRSILGKPYIVLTVKKDLTGSVYYQTDVIALQIQLISSVKLVCLEFIKSNSSSNCQQTPLHVAGGWKCPLEFTSTL